jgi:hypothetical protein
MDQDQGPDPAIAANTREYVRKKRFEEIKKRLDRDLVIYNSIRASNIRDTRASSLLGSSTLLALPWPAW